MEDKLLADNEVVFEIFEEINHSLDEYFTRMSAVHADFVPHVSFYFKNYIAGLVKHTEAFLEDEKTLKTISGDSHYVMKEIVELFRRYSKGMGKIFIEEDEKIHSLFPDFDESVTVGEVVNVINKTFLIVMMEKLLTVVRIMIEEATGIMPQNKVDSLFNDIVAENWG